MNHISFTAVKEENVWVFDHEFQNTIKEPLCNGTEKVLDEYFEIDMNRPPLKNDRLRIVASIEPFENYDTELILQTTNEEGSVYLDTTVYEEVWLCPWLKSYFENVPEKLYVRLDAVNPGAEAFKRRTGV